jgi:hypothetical protein
MKRRAPASRLQADEIDRRYGLDPVIEPDTATQAGSELDDFVTISCPYCGEEFGTRLDLSAGTCSYIEDCQVCCQPIEMSVSVDDNGALLGVDARRGD